MKKLIALLLATVMMLSMAACASKDEDTKDTTKATEDTTAATEPTTADPTDTTEPSTPATEPTTEATEPSTEPTEPTEPYVPEIGEGAYSKTSYTVSNDELAAHSSDVVSTVGDQELTMGDLQVFYWMNVYGFLNEYAYYLSAIGLDMTKPLDQQQCPETEGTWQQFFLQEALTSWHEYQALALKGQSLNIPIIEEYQTELDNLKESMEAALEESGQNSIDEMLQADIGPGIDYDSYKSYLEVYTSGYSCYDNILNTTEITDEMIEAYFTAHEEELAASEITKEKGKTVDVRHILLQPEGGTTAENGTTTYSDEEWDACRENAQAILDLWLAGDQTEEFFASLATEHTADPGSQATGGLYEDVLTGDMVEEFDAWCFDESRKVGDYGLVKTTYGYHVMYYSGDEALWLQTCREGALNEQVGAFVESTLQEYPLEVDYDKIMLGHVDLGG